MKKLLFILIFCLTKVGVAQIYTGTATNYFYFYSDSTKNTKGACDIPIRIYQDSIVLDATPILAVKITEKISKEPYLDGAVAFVKGIDNEGYTVYINLYESAEQMEIHFIYQGLEMAWILKE